MLWDEGKPLTSVEVKNFRIIKINTGACESLCPLTHAALKYRKECHSVG